MNFKAHWADMNYAWPTLEIAPHGAKVAAENYFSGKKLQQQQNPVLN